VGSARELDRLCRDHVAYQWLCGGVSLNHHTRSDFGTAHAEWLDAVGAVAGGVGIRVTWAPSG
jgi:transposase